MHQIKHIICISWYAAYNMHHIMRSFCCIWRGPSLWGGKCFDGIDGSQTILLCLPTMAAMVEWRYSLWNFIVTSCHSGHFSSEMQKWFSVRNSHWFNDLFESLIKKICLHNLKPGSKSIDSINNTACCWSGWERCCLSWVIRFVMTWGLFVFFVSCHTYQATFIGIHKIS